ncbi:MAG: RNA polymerase sigma-70 factor (ECF subfamily) [Candidatus Paceibacteria bacterium]|jgi:RNA polymerase sigma-70 factor (ECF subfamily)
MAPVMSPDGGHGAGSQGFAGTRFLTYDRRLPMDESPSETADQEMSAQAAQEATPPVSAGTSASTAPDPRVQDHASMRLALAGDETGFSDLVKRYERRAWRVARNLVPSDEDAHDLVQEGFMRVFRNLERFDFSHAFSTWLYRIVTNLAIDHLRKRRVIYSTTGSDEDEADPDLLDESAEDPAAEMEREETVNEVQACLEALAPHFQSALVLRELEGLPCNEIADIVGATHVTVRWRLHRGRKLFQEEWERRQTEQGTSGSSNASEFPSVEDSRGKEQLEAKRVIPEDKKQSSRDFSNPDEPHLGGPKKTGPKKTGPSE